MNSSHLLLLGSEEGLRVRVRGTLIAAAVYVFSLALQWHSVWTGRADSTAATWLTAAIVVGVVFFYAAIRSGFSCKFPDPAMAMPQMVFAVLAIAIAYRGNAHVRGTLLMLVALVLMFGAFTLPPVWCRRLGWFAVALPGVAMALGCLQEPALFDPAIEVVHFLFAATILPTIAILAGQLSRMRLSQRRQKRKLKDAVQRLHDIATHDELTQLVNRRHMQDWIAHELARLERTGTALCLAIIDLDHFKRVNDTFGHACGDEVLRVFAREARTVLRTVDVLARWGGEEFLVAMPDTAAGDALHVLGRLRDHLASAQLWAECPSGPVTFSAGVSTLGPGQTLEGALQRADSKLYEAKARGRNGFVADEDLDTGAGG